MDLHLIALLSIAVAVACALVIALDELRHPQPMAVMNIVWPVTALYLSVFALWGYFRLGRRSLHAHRSDRAGSPTLAQVAVGTSHCGAGCMVADVVTEFSIAAAGFTLFGNVLWANYTLDFAAAWLLGVAFQYWAIRPMRPQLGAAAVLRAAIQADTLSILAFQVGMYGFMALAYFVFFPAPHLTPFDVRYWLLMQAAMVCGYLTALPMNRALMAAGLKEAM